MAQPLKSKILTTTGWQSIDEIAIDSKIICQNGNISSIKKLIKSIQPIYNIETTEGSFQCSEIELFTLTFENKKRKTNGKLKLCKDIINTLNKNNKPNHYLPKRSVVHFNENNIAIPPYTLGCLLGDGHIADSISVTNTDKELLDKINKEVFSLGCKLKNRNNTISYTITANNENNKPAKPIRITNILTNEIVEYNRIGDAIKAININRGTLNFRCVNETIINNFKYEFLPRINRWQNQIKEEIYKLDLLNLRAWEKFIPNIYKYNTVENRLELLRGLMDTDGTISKANNMSFTTTSKRLAIDLIELVNSLGGRAILHERNRIGKETKLNNKRNIISRRISYEFNISMPSNMNPFFISRKANKFDPSYMHFIAIKSINYIGEDKCISMIIDDPNHTYITDNFLPIHDDFIEKSPQPLDIIHIEPTNATT